MSATIESMLSVARIQNSGASTLNARQSAKNA
jgi:hypothetical protein